MMFEIVRLRGRRLHLLLLEGHIMGAWNQPADPDAIVIERLDMTEDDERREGGTLYVGAWGFNRLVQFLWQRPSNRSAKVIGARISRLFPGAMMFSEMSRATVRAMMGLPDVGGDTSLWLAAAQRQLAWQPTGPLRIEHHRER